jgi:hypothetical protein
MSAAGGGGGAGVGSKRPRDDPKDCSLEGVLAECINAYARDDEDDIVNAALYAGTRSIVPMKAEATLQLTFRHHILEPAGRICVGTGADLCTLDEDVKRQKLWRTSNPAELAAVIESRVTWRDPPFFLIFWRGSEFEPPDSVGGWAGDSAKDIEKELEDEPVGLVIQIRCPERPREHGDDEDEKDAARWLNKATKEIADKVLLLIGKVKG